jgi:hypothetical protein
MIQAAGSSETVVHIYRTTLRHIPEGHNEVYVTIQTFNQYLSDNYEVKDIPTTG